MEKTPYKETSKIKDWKRGPHVITANLAYITIFILHSSQFFQINLLEIFMILFQITHPENSTPLKEEQGSTV